MPNRSTTAAPSKSEDSAIDIQKYIRWVAPVIALVLIVSTVYMWLQGRETSVRTEVLSALTEAETPEDLARVAEAYPDQPEAPLALLQAGGLHYNAADYEKAMVQYDRFLDTYSSHALAKNAAWGKWMTLEALGKFDEALAGFRSLEEEDLLYPQALLAQARIAEKQDQVQNALDLYEQVKDKFSETTFAEHARVFAERATLGIE